MKYSLEYSRLVYYTIEVDAETLEEAESIAEDELGDDSSLYEAGEDDLILKSYTILKD